MNHCSGPIGLLFTMSNCRGFFNVRRGHTSSVSVRRPVRSILLNVIIWHTSATEREKRELDLIKINKRQKHFGQIIILNSL